MKFEWDENKRESNFAKHGLDFEDAAKVFDDCNRIEDEDDRKDYGEKRIIVIGQIWVGLMTNIFVSMVVYTDRNENKRIISARKANNKEKERYKNGNR